MFCLNVSFFLKIYLHEKSNNMEILYIVISNIIAWYPIKAAYRNDDIITILSICLIVILSLFVRKGIGLIVYGMVMIARFGYLYYCNDVDMDYIDIIAFSMLFIMTCITEYQRRYLLLRWTWHMFLFLLLNKFLRKYIYNN